MSRSKVFPSGSQLKYYFKKAYSITKTQGMSGLARNIKSKVSHELNESRLFSSQKTLPAPTVSQTSERAQRYPVGSQCIKFSFLTSVYSKTPLDCFKETANCLLNQSYGHFEWVLLVNGPIEDTLMATLHELDKDQRVRLLYVDENIGIMGAMKYCLDHALGDYILPMDADDLIDQDTLQVFAFSIFENNFPSFLFANEDHRIGGENKHPYFRPGWDTAYNWANSYIWHPCCFSREKATELGLYSDQEAEYCHDWDSIFRFYSAGESIVHIPEVLYHWRQHENSTTNTPSPDSGSMVSQKNLLQRELGKRSLTDRFEIVESDIFRGAPEWMLKRKPMKGEEITVVVEAPDQNQAELFAKSLPQMGLPIKAVVALTPDRRKTVESSLSFFKSIETPLVALFNHHTQVQSEIWYWESLGQLELNIQAVAVTGKILDSQNRIIGGDDLFGLGPLPKSPQWGMSKDHLGPFGYSSKPHQGDCLNSAFFVFRSSSLKGVELPEFASERGASLPLLLSREWIAQGLALVFTPYIEVIVQQTKPLFFISPQAQAEINKKYSQSLCLNKKLGPYLPKYRSIQVGVENNV